MARRKDYTHAPWQEKNSQTGRKMMKTGIHRWVLLGLALLPLGAGCVERRFIIETDPPDAIVFFKEKPLSSSPADTQFTYYLTYEFTAQKAGYEMVVHKEKVKAPWYEYPGLDFFSENVIPWTIKDVRTIHIHMEKSKFIPPDQILPQAEILRDKGRAIEYTPPPEKEKEKERAPAPNPMMSPVNGG